MSEEISLKGDHVINLRISWDLKSRLQHLAEREHRSLSDICRVLILTGLPILEGLDRAHARAVEFRHADRSDKMILVEETGEDCG